VKVVYVNHTSRMSGGEYALLTLLDGLPPEIDPVVACPPGPLAEALRARGLAHAVIREASGSLKLHPRDSPAALAQMARAAWQLRQVLVDHEPELVHANTIRASLIALAATARDGPPVVAHVRDSLPPGRVSGLTLRALASRAAAVLPISTYTLRGLEGANSRVVHDAVDCRVFDPDSVDRGRARVRLGLRGDDRVLGIVAQITPWKGQDDAVKTLAKVKERFPDAKLLIVGSPKFVSRTTRYDNRAFLRDLEALIARLGLRDDVMLLGERTDVVDIVAALDVLLVPSWAEPFGRTVLEGMAMQVPVVATCVGGPADVIHDGEDGLLLPPRTPERWAAAVSDLLVDESRRREMGKRARIRACKSFSVEVHVRTILDVYASLVRPPLRTVA
jgi:glycosyltransferase involved in cell wall biosynthesis